MEITEETLKKCEEDRLSLTDITDISKYTPYCLMAKTNEGGPLRVEFPGFMKSGLRLGSLYSRYFKPILRPLSDLYKPIKPYIQNEPFIPLEHLAGLCLKGADWKVEESEKVALSNPYVFRFDIDDKSFHMNIEHNSDMIEYNEVCYTRNQALLFDCMNNWMIDYFDLIPRGIAIDVHTLEKNIYDFYN